MARSTRAQGATLRIEIRITEEEKAIIRDQASRASLTMSEYIRRSALNKRILSTMTRRPQENLQDSVDSRSICSHRSRSSG